MTCYTALPPKALYDERLKRPLLELLDHAGQMACTEKGARRGLCYWNNGRLAEQLGVTRRTLQNRITALIGLGYLERTEQRHANGGQTVNAYRVLFEPVVPQSEPQLDFLATLEAEGDKNDRKQPVPAPAESALDYPPEPEIFTPPVKKTPQNFHTPVKKTRENLHTHYKRPLQTLADARAGKTFCKNENPKQAIPNPSGQKTITGMDPRTLHTALLQAAGEAVDRNSSGIAILHEPLGWIAAGYDLERDILPVVSRIAERNRARDGPLIASWNYFSAAVKDKTSTSAAAKSTLDRRNVNRKPKEKTRADAISQHLSKRLGSATASP